MHSKSSLYLHVFHFKILKNTLFGTWFILSSYINSVHPLLPVWGKFLLDTLQQHDPSRVVYLAGLCGSYLGLALFPGDSSWWPVSLLTTQGQLQTCSKVTQISSSNRRDRTFFQVPRARSQHLDNLDTAALRCSVSLGERKEKGQGPSSEVVSSRLRGKRVWPYLNKPRSRHSRVFCSPSG